jgi:tripartite-type tricarboxylate transporter receptor subunit TctC
MPGFESGPFHALFAPGRTPDRIVMRLNQEVTQYLTQPEIREKLLGLGLEVVASSPAQLTATVKSEMDRIEKLLKKIGS